MLEDSTDFMFRLLLLFIVHAMWHWLSCLSMPSIPCAANHYIDYLVCSRLLSPVQPIITLIILFDHAFNPPCSQSLHWLSCLSTPSIPCGANHCIDYLFCSRLLFPLHPIITLIILFVHTFCLMCSQSLLKQMPW